MARPRQVSDEAILQAVRDAIAEHGPGVSTTVIASRVDLSQAALFKRFGTKEVLFVKALSPDAPFMMLASLAGGPSADRPFQEQLQKLAENLHAMLHEMMPRIQALRACGYGPENIFKHYEVPPPVQGVRALATWFEVGQERGLVRQDVDATTLAKALFGSLFFESHLYKIAGDWLPEADHPGHVRGVVDILCSGIVVEEV